MKSPIDQGDERRELQQQHNAAKETKTKLFRRSHLAELSGVPVRVDPVTTGSSVHFGRIKETVAWKNTVVCFADQIVTTTNP